MKHYNSLFLALLVIALAACMLSPAGGVFAADQPAAPAQGGTVKPVDWFKAQTPPNFAPNSTLPPLTRWGWAMSFDVAKELGDRWGYAVEFAGYVSEKVADEALANPSGRNGQCLALVAGNPQKYKLGVLLDRQFPKDMPPEAYLRDAQGNFIADKWNPKSLSPEMPEECLKQAGQLSAVGLAKLRTRCPIAIIQNGGEYGLNVIGWAKKYWEQDARVVAAKGDLSWYRYISRQKAREQKAVADAVRAATPGRLLYVFYTCGGDTHRHGTIETFFDDWAWDYLMQMVILARVHALFSHQEAFLRDGDLLPGPNKHAKVTDQPAYEFPTGEVNRRVLARKMPNQAKWLITAWASDGVKGPATVEIPELGSVTLQARSIGSVYTATLHDGKPVLQRVDAE